MTLTRGKWLRSLLAALAVMVVPGGTSSLWAQGFGADPFRPYNNQYDPYTYPLGPTTPGAGQSGGFKADMGTRGANQFQSYLDELSGAGRQGAERYGIGMPYYRSSIDPTFDPKGNREYRPNFKADRTYEKSQDVITRKYLAYFSEKDPKRRAELLRDYNQTRNDASRAMSSRRTDSARALEAATEADFAERRSTAATGRASGSGALADGQPRSSSARRSSRTAPAADTGRRPGRVTVPPPPALYPRDSSRRTTPRRSPSEVLDRSRRLNSGDDVKPTPGSRTGATSGSPRRPAPPNPTSD